MSIVTNMPAAEYHAHPAVSKTVLDKIARSPLHARAYMDGEFDEATAAMQFGTALHCAVLEPGRFVREYATFSGDRRTKEGKAKYEELVAAGYQILSLNDADAITSMATAIHNHPVAGPLVKVGESEVSSFWKHGTTGLECKCRADLWNQSEATIIDIKTTEDAGPAGFARSVAAYRYHVQAAHYMVGLEAKRFLFVVVEKKAPYAVAVYELDADAMREGRRLRDRDLDQYASCAEFNTWPGYPACVQTLALPKWAFNGSEE